MAAQANIAIYQGDDWAAIVSVLDGSGNAADLTGYIPAAQIRLGPADCYPQVLVEITAAIDATVTGQIDLTIPNATTMLMSGQYDWDLQITDPNGVITTLLAGQVIVTQEITRETATRRAA
jgi:hypothetical protein